MTANSEHMDYVRQVRRPNSDNFFISSWGGCVIRNVDETGNLVKFSSKATYIRNRNWSSSRIQIQTSYTLLTSAILVRK